ncbi:MAG TPA: cytochrome b, partial [Actinophytocola sp.]|nr:cytochrome b [Actinophytocola sp.]
GHTLVLGVFIPLVIFPLVLVAIAVYPFIESWVTGDKREHHILDRPRNVPTRTAFGAAWISWYFILLVGGGNDLWATHFHLSINSITWFVRIAFFVVPVLVFIATKRICLGLQRRDRDKVLHGRESGIIKRLPHGEFIEIHQPLGPVDEHGHPIPLEYQGAPVPKKMNKLGSAGEPVAGSLLRPDPPEEVAALARARAAQHALEPSESTELATSEDPSKRL